MATNTAASFTNHTGNGTAGPFNISFSYLAEAEVDVTVGGVLKTITTHYTFTSATQITFTSGNEPANGVAIKFQRDTNISAKKVDFADGSVLTEADLDANSDQVLFAQQEIIDKLGTIEENATGDQTAAEIRTLVESASDSNVFTDNDHTKLNNIEANATQDQTVSEIKSLIAGSPLDASHLAANSVDSSELVDGSVDTSHLSADCVTNAKIADDSIDSEHYVDGSIDTQHIGNSQVTTNKIADSNVTTAKIADDAVTTSKISDLNVTTAKIAHNAINSNKLANDSVTTTAIADNAVTTAKINGSAVTTARLANSAVTSDKIAASAVGTARIADDAVTTAKIADAELKTLAGMQSATASKLADSTALTSDIADLNQLDGMAKQTTITDDDTKFPTSGAVVDFVAAQIAPLGGLEVVATDAAFPNTQPSAGVVISISDAGGVAFNGSGTSTTARTVGGSTVTINNAPSSLNNETLVAGVGLMVSSTGSGQIYNYHKILGKEDDIKQLSDDINDFNARYRVVSSNPTSNNDAGDLIFNTSTQKLLVFNATSNAFEEAQSVGNFFISTLSPAFDGSTQDFTITNAPSNAQQIILSINGVIQKPNSGTSTPSEGFALTGSTVKLAAAPPTGSDYFAIVLGSTVNIGTPSDNTVTSAILQNGSVTTAKIVDDAITGDKIATNLDLPDNNKIRFGTGNDLQIFHDGSHSVIQETGTGDLEICTNTRIMLQKDRSEVLAKFIPDGAVELYYDNVLKLETGSSGITIAGSVFANTGGGQSQLGTHLDLGDNQKVRLGASDDLQIYHDGSHNIINGAAGQNLEIQTNAFRVNNQADSESMIVANADGAVELYHDNSKKFETTADGVDVTNISNNNGLDLNGVGNNTCIRFMSTGSSPAHAYRVNYHSVTNNIFNSPCISFDKTNTSGTFDSHIGAISDDGFHLADNKKLHLGGTSASGDLQIYHDGSNSYIQDTDQGNLFIDASAVLIRKNGTTENMAKFIQDGAVELYHDNSKKFETTSTGIAVSGNDNTFSAGANAVVATFSSAFGGAGATSVIRLKMNTSGVHGIQIQQAGSGTAVAGGNHASTFFNTENARLRLGTNNGEKFRIEANGDLKATDTSIAALSDSRLKKNIVDFTYDLNKFKNLRPRIFDWINPELHLNQSQVRGFVAQEIEAVDSTLVGDYELFDETLTDKNPDLTIIKNDDGTNIAKDSKLGTNDAMYISVIQQMLAKIEVLETKVAALEAA